MIAMRPLIVKARALIFLLILAGCATHSTIETRRQERLSAYDALPADQKAMVDAGQIRVGMPSDAVYIAWGQPSEILESEDPQQGHLVFWRYFGSWLQENRYWAYREVDRGPRGGIYVERYLTSDYSPRDYVRSEIVLKEGKVLSWRTLPKPAY
jgi:hypothetical protein